ncbi:OsmC family protein [Myroides sp. LJL119]
MENKVIKVLGFSARKRQFAVKTENFSFTVDDGLELVRGKNKESKELLLASLAGSLHSIGYLIGNTLNLDLKSIQIEVKAHLDEKQADSVHLKNFKKVDVIIKPTSPASIVILKEWIDAVKVACPVFSEFKSTTPTIITLVKEYEQVNLA